MGTMHGGTAVVASAFQETPRSAAMAAAADYLPAADKKMTQQAQAPPASSSDDNDSSNTNSSRRRLEGKVAIVTGGARGIGEAIARLFVAHGARVVIADVVDDAAGQAVASSLGPPEQCSYERCDVSVEADVERAVRCAVARHGRLDVLCNNVNAGVVGRQAPGTGSSSILALDAAELERVVRVNALGMKHAAGAMLKLKGKAAGEGEGGGGGSIVSVASVAVAGGMGPHAYTAASKHALVGLTMNAACELGRHGIRVNCISPFGVGVATPMLLCAWRDKDQEHGAAAAAASESDEQEEKEELVRGLATLKQKQKQLQLQGATLKASDIAEAALFLASDDSRYMSGHNLVVDGGVTTARNLIGL